MVQQGAGCQLEVTLEVGTDERPVLAGLLVAFFVSEPGLLSAAAGIELTGNGHLGLLPAAMSEIVVLSQNVMLATDL